MEDSKLIKISKATDEKLGEIGNFGESYDGVIRRVIADRAKCTITMGEKKSVETPNVAIETQETDEDKVLLPVVEEDAVEALSDVSEEEVVEPMDEKIEDSE